MPAKDEAEVPSDCPVVGNHSDAVKAVPAAAAVPPGRTGVALRVFSSVELGVVALGVAAAAPIDSGMGWPDDDAPGKSVAVRVPAWTSCCKGGQKSAATKVSCETYSG